MNELKQKPVLVTGMHRSGTSWLGSILCAGGAFINIGEPLNVSNRQTIFPARVRLWYQHITEGNEDDYLRYYEDAIRLKAHPFDDLRRMRLGSPRDPVRVPKRWASLALGRLERRRLLIKDPFAVLSIDWFVRRLGCRVVVTVRHPLAVVSSLKRHQFRFDFDNLLRQPLLMEGKLAPFRSEIEAARESPDDLIGHGSLLWRIIYETLESGDDRSPEVRVVRHEDLSMDPMRECEPLYDFVGVEFTPAAARKIEASASDSNPSEVSKRDPFQVRLASRTNLTNWERRLEPAEIDRILEIAGPVVARYYPEGVAAIKPVAPVAGGAG